MRKLAHRIIVRTYLLGVCMAVASQGSIARDVPVVPARATQLAANATGCVVFRRGADGNAVMNEYRSYKASPEYIDVTDVAGHVFRVFSTQKPVFIPYPSDTLADPDQTKALIQEVRKTYPVLSARLAGIEQAWAARPLPAVASGPAPVPSPPSPPSPAPFPGGTVMVGGKKLTGVTVTRVQADGLTITHDEGIANVPFMDLPEEVRKYYGYDPTRVIQQQARVPQQGSKR